MESSSYVYIICGSMFGAAVHSICPIMVHEINSMHACREEVHVWANSLPLFVDGLSSTKDKLMGSYYYIDML